MSRHSLAKSKNKYSQSSSQQSLPEEWGSLQKRVEYLETMIAKIQKRSQKTEKKVTRNEQQLGSLRKEFDKKISELLSGQINLGVDRERQVEFQSLRDQLSELHSYIKRVDKKNQQILKEIKMNSFGAGSRNMEDQIQDKIEDKLDGHFQNTKAYIDRAVAELKLLVRQYAQQQPQPTSPRRTTNDLSRSISKSRVSANQRSSQKLMKASHVKYEQNDTSFEEKSKLLSSPKNQNMSVANGSSRVSYLRQKLKEFEQINKKYEDKVERTDRKAGKEDEERRSVQKMKEFKNYLDQSQSQIQQSNLDIKEDEMLTDSIRKWRNANKYNGH